jgi:peptide-methionine (R)-S-oxide reductase
MNRRELFATVAIATILLWPLAAAAANPVEITDFSTAGLPLGKVRKPKVTKTEAEWRALLSPLAFEVTRQASTERPFTGPGWNNHADGLYRCICCGTALFDSRTKFESGTGWPSFWKPIAAGNVNEIRDTSLYESRTAVSCALCDAHLGHVFSDGPRPTGLRYCMNAVALKFVPRA